MRGSKWNSDADRFWAKVDRRGDDDCWVWMASTREGYGQFKIGGKRGRMAKAHRVSWEMHFGSIPTTADSAHGTCVCHRCDNPLCVNPRHLFLGTQRENIKDRTLKLRTGRALDPEAVGLARRLIADGVPIGMIAKRLGVTTSPIYAIKRGVTWRHVT